MRRGSTDVMTRGARRRRGVTTLAAALAVTTLLVAAVACGSDGGGATSASSGRPRLVVSFPVLGSVVSDLVGDQAEVTVLMGPGIDPHDYRPSARDASELDSADLIVINGLGLEESLDDAIAVAEARDVPVFRATDHIDVRPFDEGEIASGEEDEEHAPGAPDPHVWLDPVAIKQVVAALAETVRTDVGLDLGARAAALEQRLGDLDTEIRSILEVVPPDQRLLVTGHESMGYFARRYGFELVGAVIPSGGTQAAPTAAGLAQLTELIRRLGVRAVFTETGTPPDVARTVASETGTKLVELPTHTLPPDGSYFTMMREIAHRVASGLTDGPSGP
ncbi:metal ABC transporter substrate-binding protein [Rhabdothermincola sediminis]|uniref:metal ABC transporter substrate-binding protein n=1 Tax=Rhabdothermincola sediminis TaxID=2751370 RepID=UPI001AA036A8|nr:metal ABC transporter substrate-binding protein [Rhabdothermincola sediminis]